MSMNSIIVPGYSHPLYATPLFALGELGSLLLTSPVDGATEQPTIVDFEWEAYPGADHYHLFYTPDGGSEVEVADIAGTSHQVSGLDPNTLYTWHVTAHESVDGPVPLAESETWEFTTAAASDTAWRSSRNPRAWREWRG